MSPLGIASRRVALHYFFCVPRCSYLKTKAFCLLSDTAHQTIGLNVVLLKEAEKSQAKKSFVSEMKRGHSCSSSLQFAARLP